jgi:hypothetical protein
VIPQWNSFSNGTISTPGVARTPAVTTITTKEAHTHPHRRDRTQRPADAVAAGQASRPFEGPMMAISARLAASRLHYAWVIIALTLRQPPPAERGEALTARTAG